MSEVRRVPMDYKHPIEHNPYWYAQESRNNDIPRDMRYVALYNGCSFVEAVNRRSEDREKLAKKQGFEWNWAYQVHFTGYYSKSLETDVEANPKYYHSDDTFTIVESEDHLLELLLADMDESNSSMFSINHYTPVPVTEEEMNSWGYTLYETVSDGTPLTPVLETASELIDYLVSRGDYWGRSYSRQNAEALVSQGWGIGSFVMVNGTTYDSDTQVAEIQRALG